MSSWIGFTNQKLYQCRLLLDAYRACQQPALASALDESALYQLHDAWLSYLHELADMVSFRESVTSLQDLTEKVNLVTGEMRELQQLADDAFSWLSQMLKAVGALKRPDTPQVVSAAADTPQTISLTAEITESQVGRWWSALNSVIDAQRENRQES